MLGVKLRTELPDLNIIAKYFGFRINRVREFKELRKIKYEMDVAVQELIDLL